MSSMYEITAEGMRLINTIIEAEGELTPEVEQALLINEQNFDAKMEAYVKAIKNMDSDTAGLKEEIDRLTAMKRRNEKAVERMKKAMLTGLQVVKGGEKTRIGNFTFSIRQSEAVNVLDIDQLQPSYVTTKVEPNKTAIKEALKAGQEVPGAEIVTNMSLSIR